MRKLSLTLWIVLSSLTLYCQVKISSNSWFLQVDNSEKYIVYFQSETKEPDDFIEGKLVIYDIENEASSKFNDQTYILDFITSHIGEDGSFLISNGRSIRRFLFLSGETNEIIKVKEGCLITDFYVSNNSDEIFYSVVEQSSGEYRVIKENLDGKDQSELYRQKLLKRSGERLGIYLEVNDNMVFLKNIDNELIAVNQENNEVVKIDQDIKTLFSAGNGLLYYAKKNSLIEYDIKSNKKLEILQGESLRFSFLKPNSKGLFISFNDNIFVYNKVQQTMNNVESLPKIKYVYFSESLAVSTVDKSIYVERNSN